MQIHSTTGARANVPGTGRLRVVLGSVPAAGAECKTFVPSGKTWRILAAQYKLVTSATVAARNVRIGFSDGAGLVGNEFYGASAANTQAASLTFTYELSGLPFAGGTGQNDQYVPIPDLLLPAGTMVRSVTQNIQVGDQYAAPVLLVEEWDV